MNADASRQVFYKGAEPSAEFAMLAGEHKIMIDVQDSVGLKVTVVVDTVNVLPMRVDFSFIEGSMNSALVSDKFSGPAS